MMMASMPAAASPNMNITDHGWPSTQANVDVNKPVAKELTTEPMDAMEPECDTLLLALSVGLFD